MSGKSTRVILGNYGKPKANEKDGGRMRIEL